MLKEFKEFALKGNLIDMSVAFVMGAAFTKFSGSFIDDLIMPFVAKISSGMDFSNSYISLSEKVPAGLALIDAKKLGPVVAWGNFVSISINFLIIAFVMFLVVKAMNKLKKAEATAPAAPPAPSAQEVLLAEIRDLLKK
ncbi:MAG: large conductance mechanosensitive channel protein MscL [Verrucomicrobiota bacterium]|jgi:large conductance mechanosensitive channel